MLSKGQIVSELQLFAFSGSIIDRWLQLDDQHQVLRRLATVNEEPLSHVELNQLLLLSHEAAVSDAFFEYYWLSKPEHSYNIDAIPGHDAAWHGSPKITSLEQLKWGLYRIYVDGLLYFGNVRRGFRATRSKNNRELAEFFGLRRFDTKAIRRRGAPLPLAPVVKDDRYLISEMACKSYGINPFQGSDLKTALVDAWREHSNAGGGGIPLRRLLAGDLIRQRYQYQQYELQFSIDDIVEEVITSEDDLTRKYERIAQRFSRARENAMQNTELYLSMINDLDVYVATSMRSRKDFREMADNCEKIFSDSRLRELHLRYFDPTLSAAAGHEDKGLIECLMVKSAKALIYCAGEKDSYGKDAEAAMALSLGKPVIFFAMWS